MYRIQQEDEYIGCTSTKFCYREKLSDAQTVFGDYKRVIDELQRRQSEQYVEGKPSKPLHRYSVYLYKINTISADSNDDELIDSYVLENELKSEKDEDV